MSDLNEPELISESTNSEQFIKRMSGEINVCQELHYSLHTEM
jgi:hypothetical protein